MNSVMFLVALTTLSSSPLFVKASAAPIEFLGFWRLFTAGLILVGVEVVRRGPGAFTKRPLREWTWPLISGVFFFLHLWTYVAAAKTTSVAHLVILFATNPLFTVAGAALFFGEPLRRRLLIAYPLAFAGLWLLVGEKVSLAPESHWGDIMAVLSAVLHAAYLLSSKRARRNLDNVAFSSVLYLSAGVLFAVAGWLRPGPTLSADHWQAWAAVAGLIVFPTFLGHAVMTQLLTKMDVSVLSCGKLLEPGLSSLLAYLFFDEHVTPVVILAFGLTAAAVLILFWPNRWLRT